jgi:hypothetical protein
MFLSRLVASAVSRPATIASYPSIIYPNTSLRSLQYSTGPENRGPMTPPLTTPVPTTRLSSAPSYAWIGFCIAVFGYFVVRPIAESREDRRRKKPDHASSFDTSAPIKIEHTSPTHPIHDGYPYYLHSRGPAGLEPFSLYDEPNTYNQKGSFGRR